MKKFFILIFLFSGSYSFAQTPEDALRLTWQPTNGTARNMAIGGAMGSLGGDLTSVYTNPAGLAMYKNPELVLSPGFLMNKYKINFRDEKTNEKKNSFEFGPTGLIFGGMNNNYKSRSFAFAVSANQLANFKNTTSYSGYNNVSSYAEQFAEQFVASGYTIDEVLNINSPMPFDVAPALYTYLIDTTGGEIRAAPEFILNNGQALRQSYVNTTAGSLSEINLAGALNFGDRWLVGGSFGLPILVYNSNLNYQESDTSLNTYNFFNSFQYNDNFKSSGVGAIARLGVIFRPQEYLRFGLSINSPMYMSITERRTTSLTSELENPVGTYTVNSNKFTGNVQGENKYDQLSAWKFNLSGSYVFREVENTKRQKGFITADLEYVGHGGSKFMSSDNEPTAGDKAYYKELSKVVKDQYKGTFNGKIGGELKFNTVMGRLGFAYYGNPYRDKQLKANKMLLSGGLGYRNHGMYFDLTYVHQLTKDVHFPYRLSGQPNSYATLNNTRGNIVATIGFKL